MQRGLKKIFKYTENDSSTEISEMRIRVFTIH